MAINKVEGTQQAQPAKRTETKKDANGNTIKCIFEDRNGDGKLDLYSVTKNNPSWDGCTHEITYFDNDGDGYFDSTQEKIASNMKSSDGTRLSQNDKVITEEFQVKNDATKMENLVSGASNTKAFVSKKVNPNDINKIIKIDSGNIVSAKKEITEVDLKNISDKKPVEAVEMLMDKSPVGKTLPSDDELAKMGHKKQPYMTSNGDTFYGNNLVITTHLLNPPKGAVKKATYKVGRFEQVMYYDKDNNLIKGDFKIMDDIEGKYPESHYGIWRNDNGGYSYIN